MKSKKIRVVIASALIFMQSGCGFRIEDQQNTGRENKYLRVEEPAIDDESGDGGDGGDKKQYAAIGNDKNGESPPVVMSTAFGICVDLGLPVIVNFESAGDFTAGNVRIGSGPSFRRIEYGIGTSFDKELPYKTIQKIDTPYQVFTSDQRKYGITNVKVVGIGQVTDLDVIFSYPIGDKISLDHTKRIISALVECKVVRT